MKKWNLKVSGDVLAGSRTEHILVLSGICWAWTLRIHKFWPMFLVSGSGHHPEGPQGRIEVPDWLVNSVRFNSDFSLGISRVLLGVLWSMGLQRVGPKSVTEQPKKLLRDWMEQALGVTCSWSGLHPSQEAGRNWIVLPEFVTVSWRCSINLSVLMTTEFVELSCPLFNVSGTDSIFLLPESWGINHFLHSLILSYIQKAYWVTLVFQRQSQAIGNRSYKNLIYFLS